MKINDYVRTPRFCTVRINAISSAAKQKDMEPQTTPEGAHLAPSYSKEENLK